MSDNLTLDASAKLSTLLDEIKSKIKEAEEIAKKHELPFSLWLDNECGGDFGLQEGYWNYHGEYSYLDEYSDIDWNDEEAVQQFTDDYGSEHVEQMRNRTFTWNRWISSSEMC